MKRIFTYIAIAALAVSCSELYGGPEASKTPDTAGSVEIAFSDVADNSFKVTVAPTGEASYYSYLVDESPVAQTLDAATLYSVKYSSLAQGTAKAADAPSTILELADLKPNTTYQVYAVAGSPMGIVGEVVVKSVTTSDGVNPSLTASNYEDTVLELTFSEAVSLAEGTATLRYFARQKAGINENVAEGTYTVPADSIVCDGKTVTFTFAGEVPAGAYYTLDYPAGMFVDSANNPAAELKSGFSAASGSLAPYGVYGRADFANWEFDAYEETVFTDPSQSFVFTSSAAQICKLGEAAASVSYTKGAKTTTIALTPGSDYVCGLMSEDPESDIAMFALPEAPDFGSAVTITVPEDTFWDIYGNSNAAFEVEVLLSFGYTLEDVIGTYSGQGMSYFQGAAVALGFTVAESDNPELGNVMITGSYMGLPCSAGNIYADFDGDGGILRVYDWQKFFVHPSAGDVYFAINGADYVDIKMPESGVLASPSEWFGAYIDGAQGGWFDVYTDIYLVKQPATEGAAVTSVPELKARTVGKAL